MLSKKEAKIFEIKKVLNKKHKSNSKLKTSHNYKHNYKYKLLGKKRKLQDYKSHSLLESSSKTFIEKTHISLSLNINSLSIFTHINPSLMKGNFKGLFTNGDLLIEQQNPTDPSLSNYIVYSNKTFTKKLSFIEDSSGIFYLLKKKDFGAFNCKDYVKIYKFLENNTNVEIIQKIMLPDDLLNKPLFLFEFTHNEDYYFFLKIFGLQSFNELLLFKLNNSLDINNFYKKEYFKEDISLLLNFPFIWFVQKNNNELLFFYELNSIFYINCFDFPTQKVTHSHKFSIFIPINSKIANYPDKIINKDFLFLTNDNLIYVIDTKNYQISTIKEEDIIEFIKVFNDNTIWTIEKNENEFYYKMEKNKKIKKNFFYLRQYLLCMKTQELIKIGERKIRQLNFIKDLVQLSNDKVLFFVSKNKIKMFRKDKCIDNEKNKNLDKDENKNKNQIVKKEKSDDDISDYEKKN